MKKLFILLSFSILLSSCSRESKELNFKERCKNVQNIIKKDLENYTQQKSIKNRKQNRFTELRKLGLNWTKDPTYNSINAIHTQLKNKQKEIKKERNNFYKELFLIMGLDKKSVLENMKHIYGGVIRETTYKNAFGNYESWITYTKSEQYEIAQDWYYKNDQEAKSFCNEFGIDLLEPYENFEL